MNELDQDTLIRLRTVMLEILDEFARVCKKNNLTYFLTAGTLIGAVRHKGFIPWDDDIDIAMPRNDYLKFLEIINNSTDPDYYIYSPVYPNGNSYHFFDRLKFCKKNTVWALSYINNPKNYPGICITIFPFDNCFLPLLPFQYLAVKFSKSIYKYKTHHNVNKTLCIRLIIKLFCLVFSIGLLKAILKKSCMLFNNLNTKYISFLTGFKGIRKETHRYDTIFPLTELSFEGKKHSVPGSYDTFLKTLYDSNYMKIPPVEKRRSHSSKFIVFNTLGEDSL